MARIEIDFSPVEIRTAVEALRVMALNPTLLHIADDALPGTRTALCGKDCSGLGEGSHVAVYAGPFKDGFSWIDKCDVCTLLDFSRQASEKEDRSNT